MNKWAEDPGHVARVAFTVVLLAISAWWLWVVAQKLSIQPQLSDDGKVIFDEYSRSKDVLLVVLPLLTLALGYWFGSAGAAKAEEKADKAEDKAGEKDKQLQTALGLLPPDLYQAAVAADPQAFGVGREG